MNVVNADIFTLKQGVICHQISCRAVMGRGIAAAMRAKYPLVYLEYMKLCNSMPSKQLLGMAQVIQVTPELKVVNIFGQLDYAQRGLCHTDYGAVETAFLDLSSQIGNVPITVPYNMGCGLAGGDWAIYSEIIERAFPQAVAYKL